MNDCEQFRPKRSKDALSQLLAGIDRDIKRIFLSLPQRKLSKVFLEYGRTYGISKVIYAKSTYPKWQDGSVTMSGVVVARLLNLVPLAIGVDELFELVKKLRTAYIRKQDLEVSCDTSNWFKKVPPIVDGLVDYSNQFELPIEVVERLEWLSNGDGKAVQKMLAAIEVEEARVRTQYLKSEYARIGRMLNSIQGTSEMTHKIEIPQGSVTVTISKRRFSVMNHVPLTKSYKQLQKRRLAIICKNQICGTEVETTLSVYDGEPVECTAADVTCHICGMTFTYDVQDLSRTRKNLNVEIRKGFFGGYLVSYDCPACSTRLRSPVEDAGRSDSCPHCKVQFVVPSG